jgi:hypothetical protein
MIGALGQAQWLLNQDAVITRYEMNLAAAANQPFSQPPPPLPPLDGARSEEKKKPLQSAQKEGQSDGSEALLGLGGPVIPEKGLRSFGTLAAFYSVESPIAVEKFLQNHTQLVALLFSAFPRLKSTWGAEIKPELTLLEDPEGGYPVLMVRLISNRADAYEALDRFDDEWWLDHIRDAEGLLNFSLHAR